MNKDSKRLVIFSPVIVVHTLKELITEFARRNPEKNVEVVPWYMGIEDEDAYANVPTACVVDMPIAQIVVEEDDSDLSRWKKVRNEYLHCKEAACFAVRYRSVSKDLDVVFQMIGRPLEAILEHPELLNHRWLDSSGDTTYILVHRDLVKEMEPEAVFGTLALQTYQYPDGELEPVSASISPTIEGPNETIIDTGYVEVDLTDDAWEYLLDEDKRYF